MDKPLPMLSTFTLYVTLKLLKKSSFTVYMTDDTAASVSLLSGEHGMITYVRWLTTVKSYFLNC